MRAVRAKATTGFNSGKAANSGRRVKPMARRAGTTSSRALQIVGVSNARRASRSARSGRRGMSASSDNEGSPPGFIGNAPGHQGLSVGGLLASLGGLGKPTLGTCAGGRLGGSEPTFDEAMVNGEV